MVDCMENTNAEVESSNVQLQQSTSCHQASPSWAGQASCSACAAGECRFINCKIAHSGKAEHDAQSKLCITNAMLSA
jgi:hypothetical protein